MIHRHIWESRITTNGRTKVKFSGKASQETLWRLFERLSAISEVVVKLGVSITTHTNFPHRMPWTSSTATSPTDGICPNLSSITHQYSISTILSYSLLQSDQWIKSSMFRSAVAWSIQNPATAGHFLSKKWISRLTSDIIAIRMQCNLCYHSCFRCSQQWSLGYSRWVMTMEMKRPRTFTLRCTTLHTEGPDSPEWSRIQSSMDQRWSHKIFMSDSDLGDENHELRPLSNMIFWVEHHINWWPTLVICTSSSRLVGIQNFLLQTHEVWWETESTSIFTAIRGLVVEIDARKWWMLDCVGGYFSFSDSSSCGTRSFSARISDWRSETWRMRSFPLVGCGIRTPVIFLLCQYT